MNPPSKNICWDCLDGKHTGWCKNCNCTKCWGKVIARAVKVKDTPPLRKPKHPPRPRPKKGGKAGRQKGQLGKLSFPGPVRDAIATELLQGGTLTGVAQRYQTTREKVRTVQKHLASLAPEKHPDGCVQVWLDQIEAHKERTA